MSTTAETKFDPLVLPMWERPPSLPPLFLALSPPLQLSPYLFFLSPVLLKDNLYPQRGSSF